MKRALVALLALAVLPLLGADDPRPKPPALSVEAILPKFPSLELAPVSSASPATSAQPPALMTSAQTMVLFTLMSLAPAAALMVTAFVRINIVLTLLRQALGSPQVPGNQVLMALSLLLTALVMQPVARSVYDLGIKPYSEQRLDAKTAWEAGSAPIKEFMIVQMERTRHSHYMTELYDQSPHPAGEPEPTAYEQYSLSIVAPAYLLSELTTALYIGFSIYLPFLVIDMVVSAVLGAMGLFMLPPSLVSMPLKLVLFVLADGWMLVAGMLLRSFG